MPPIWPINGPKEDIKSYYLNQLGLAGGHVPLLSYFIEGQSRFNFIRQLYEKHIRSPKFSEILENFEEFFINNYRGKKIDYLRIVVQKDDENVDEIKKA